MELFDKDYQTGDAQQLFGGVGAQEHDLARHQLTRDWSRLDELYRLKLAGRDPERIKRRQRSLHEVACWIAVALLMAAALMSPVRAAEHDAYPASPSFISSGR